MPSILESATPYQMQGWIIATRAGSARLNSQTIFSVRSRREAVGICRGQDLVREMLPRRTVPARVPGRQVRVPRCICRTCLSCCRPTANCAREAGRRSPSDAAPSSPISDRHGRQTGRRQRMDNVTFSGPCHAEICQRSREPRRPLLQPLKATINLKPNIGDAYRIEEFRELEEPRVQRLVAEMPQEGEGIFRPPPSHI